MPNRNIDIISVSMRDSLVGTNEVDKHFPNNLPMQVDSQLFLGEKLTYCEQHTIETLINNSFIAETVILPFE